MSHYFSNDYQKSNKQKFDFTFKNQKFIFNTDDNVFSKNEVDFGSQFLVETVLNDTTLSGTVLDLGCGYGTICVLLAKFSNAKFIACDINERAVTLCEQNAKDNNLSNINCLVSDACNSVEEKDFDYIISNPPIRAGNAVLFEFFSSSYRKLKDGGVSYWVFRKQQGAETYTKKLESIYGNAKVLDKKKSFWIVKCERNS